MSISTPVFVISEEQKRQLEQWLAASGTPQQVALRSRLVLAVGAGKSEATIAAELKRQSKNSASVAGAFCGTGTTRSLGD